MRITTQQAVTSADNAATDSLDRYLNEVCTEEIEEKEFFELQMLEKTFDVFVNCTPYDFEPFNRKNRPKNAGCIMELIKRKSFEKDQYRIVVRPNATSEMIQAALTMIVLPF